MLLGTHLTMLIGPTVPIPAPQPLAEAIQSVEVTHRDQGRSGFQITFQVGRSGPVDLLDYGLLQNPLLRPFSRIVLVVTFNVLPTVLMDGMITNLQLSPGTEPGTSTLSVTGEDVSIMMDLEKKRVEHPAQDETLIALKILASHLQYFLSPPTVIPPLTIDPPIPIERTPVQQGTDLEYLNEMAGRHGYVFYVEPGPLPLMNRAYWGPPPRLGVPQPALSVNMGHETNVGSISFQYNALAPTTVKGEVQDRLTNQTLPVQTFASLRPPLASQPALPFNLPNVRTSLLEQSEGLNYMQAFARAQATTDASMDSVVSANGELDALRYGRLLQPRGLVGLRGVGYTNDGFYYVKSVTHAIQKGQYTQRFSLTREGVGALSPVVMP
jgi:hypothetical protein